MQLSIIIPMYNAKSFIIHLLDSIYIQDDCGIKFEVIIVDDASTDNSANLVLDYRKKNQIVNLVLINAKTNGGTAVARNLGLSCSNYDWVQFVDSDDWVPHNYFKLIRDPLVDPEIDCFIYGTKSHFGDKVISNTPKGHIDQRMIGYKNIVVNKIYRKRMLIEFESDFYFEDVIWLVRVMNRGIFKCRIIDNLYYNINRENTNSKTSCINNNEWKKMAMECIAVSKLGNDYVRAFVLETFVGTLFTRKFKIGFRIEVAIRAISTNYEFLNLVRKNGIRKLNLIEEESNEYKLS